jgi:sRNA-binding regulator protein Hfq
MQLDIYLMNGKKFQVNVRNTDSTDHVMQVAGQTCILICGMVPLHSTFT